MKRASLFLLLIFNLNADVDKLDNQLKEKIEKAKKAFSKED
ncbi:hypothetical protein [Borreliella carolinensis]|uniref:Uncharacterized protein n=1 Tax=Borreliella carolinensis TaxID=478174 RepID=A0ACD5GLL2_9SPIR